MALNLLFGKDSGAKSKGGAQDRSNRLKGYQPADKLALSGDALEQCIQLERFGTIAQHRDQFLASASSKKSLRKAIDVIDGRFAVVPEGFVSLPITINDTPGCPERDIDTEAFLLSRFAVTNREYQGFVDTGGYEDLELWPEDIWPHLLDFKDLSGNSGPRYWESGRHDKRLSNHPVVGVCWYEVSAFCRWAGYRLPTEAEWQMAASWRVRSSAYVLKRYPWGDSMDVARCNIWSSNIRRTVPVDEYDSGAAPNGVLQLIGNVWEWTACDFDAVDDEGRPVVGDMLMKSVRGGAYDTYFASQTTSLFRTGLAGLVRAHNVGFRCILPADMDAIEASLQDEG